MSTDAQNPADPFIRLSDLAREPGVTRAALEMVIRARKLTVISRYGQYWVHRADVADWLAYRASLVAPAGPTQFFEL